MFQPSYVDTQLYMILYIVAYTVNIVVVNIDELIRQFFFSLLGVFLHLFLDSLLSSWTL